MRRPVVSLILLLVGWGVSANGQDNVAASADMAAANAWVAANWDAMNPSNIPVTFEFGGTSSRSVLGGWTKLTPTSTTSENGKVTNRVQIWTNSSQAVSFRVELKTYADFPVVEWTAWLSKGGSGYSSQIRILRAADMTLAGATPTLRGIRGDDYSANSYQPYQTLLSNGATQTFSGDYGKPSSQNGFPYFNLVQTNGTGTIMAVGWPGQWFGTFQGTSGGATFLGGQSYGTTSVREIRMALAAGEQIRTPSMTLLFWKGGDWETSQNLWRRWYRAYVLPKTRGVPQPDVRQIQVDGKSTSSIAAFFNAGIYPEIAWRDAGSGYWTQPTVTGTTDLPQLPGNSSLQFLNTTGVWNPDAATFPGGFTPFSEFVRTNGMKFLVWFEPERVGYTNGTAGAYSQPVLATTNPSWLLPNPNVNAYGSVFDLGNPNAQAWLLDHIDGLIKTQGIGWYREDLNGIGPLEGWNKRDSDLYSVRGNRFCQGLTENLHVQGHLAFWDGLRQRNPDLRIDSCASGGRRNDLESMRRAVPLLRSDFLQPTDGTNVVEGNQGHTYGLSYWLPYQGSGCYFYDSYGYRSFLLASSGMEAILAPNTLAIQQEAFEESRLVGPYFVEGDYYPLFPYSLAETDWIGWQFYLPGNDTALVQAFRRASNNSPNATIYLRGLQTNRQYLVRNLDSTETVQKSGQEMMSNGLVLNLPQARSAGLWKIEPVPAATQNAGADFWWSGKGGTNGLPEWVARGGSTNPNPWSYGVVNVSGGSQPSSLAASSGGPTGRGIFGNFRDLSLMESNTVIPTSPFVWLYRSPEGAEVGSFGSAWTNVAPGFNGDGAGRVTNGNTKYLWLKPAGSAGDGYAAALRYTAPLSREYRIRGEFVPGGDGSSPGNTQSFAILRSGSNLDPTNRTQDAFLLPRTVVADDGPVTTYDLTVSLRAGDTLTWVVGTDGGTNTATGGNGNQMGVSAEVQQALLPTVLTVTGPTKFFVTGGASYPSYQKSGSTLPAVLSFSGTGTTSYGPSPTPPSAVGTYRLTVTVAADGTYGSGLLQVDYSILNPAHSAFTEFWWNGLVRNDVTSPNNMADWTNTTKAASQNRSTNTPTSTNAWSYGLVNCSGGSPTDPYPTQIDGTQPGRFENGLTRDTWNQFWDITQNNYAQYANGPPLWLYESGGAQVGWFGSAWTTNAPGRDGTGAGRNGLSTNANSNTRYLWMKVGGSTNDGTAPAVRWTAPTAGTYRFTGEFLPGGTVGGGTLSTAIVTAGSGVTSNILLPRAVLDQDGAWRSFDFTATMVSGQTVTWLVGSDGGSSGDIVGLQAEISPVLSPLTLSGITPSNKTYDGTTAATWSGTPALGGKASGDDVSLAALQAAFTSPGAGSNKPVTYPSWSLAGANSDRYQLTVPTNQTATISPAPLQVSAEAKRKAADQADPPLTWQAAGWQGTDTNSLMTGTLSRTAGTQPGSYPILQGTLSAGSNYAISYTGANLIVDQSFAFWSSNQPFTADLFLKYAVGGASGPQQSSESLTQSLTGGTLSLVAAVRTNDPTLSFRGEYTDNLGASWNTNLVSVTTHGVSQTNLPSGTERRRYSVDQGTNTRRFLRVTIQK